MSALYDFPVVPPISFFSREVSFSQACQARQSLSCFSYKPDRELFSHLCFFSLSSCESICEFTPVSRTAIRGNIFSKERIKTPPETSFQLWVLKRLHGRFFQSPLLSTKHTARRVKENSQESLLLKDQCGHQRAGLVTWKTRITIRKKSKKVPALS